MIPDLPDNVNLAFARIEDPFFRIFKDYLCLFLKPDGTVVRIFDNRNMTATDLIGILKQEKNVFKVFDLAPFKDLHEAGRSEALHPIRAGLTPLESLQDFLTDIPTAFITIRRIDPDLYLGAIKTADFIPLLPFSNSNHVLFLDHEDALRGFNENFLSLLGRDPADPSRHLGRPLGDVITPTPLEIQRRHLLDLKKRSDNPWEPAGDLKSWATQGLLKSGDGWSARSDGSFAWENPSDSIRLLYLPALLNTAECDFRIRLQGRKTSGSGVILIAAEKAADPRDPDRNGYTVAEAWGFKGMMLKKKGTTIHWNEAAGVPEEVSWVFEKRGRGLFLSSGGKNALEYFDPHFIQHAKGGFILGLRPGSGFILENFQVDRCATMDTEKPFSDQEIVLSLCSRPGRRFTLSLFPNRYLSSVRPDLKSFLLTEITYFEEKAEQYRRQYREEKRKGAKLSTLLEAFGGTKDAFIGASPEIEAIRNKCVAVAASTLPVLIEGPTGTGKEVLAAHIHGLSPRKEGPFIKVDCSALPESLIESELFGHEKGAFTGAQEPRAGRFEQANGGTLFLDEVGNLSLSIQRKLLGVLQDFSITRLGGVRPVSLDIRLIAASNIPLGSLVRGRAFREDLYYRINGLLLSLPQLKERREDLPLLCRHFIAVFNAAEHKAIEGLAPSAFRKLYEYPWPGNIRELRNVLRQAHLFCRGKTITDDLLQLAPPREAVSVRAAGSREHYHLKGMSREKFLALAKRHGGVVSRMAAELGVSRRACYDNLARYRIDITAFRR